MHQIESVSGTGAIFFLLPRRTIEVDEIISSSGGERDISAKREREAEKNPRNSRQSSSASHQIKPGKLHSIEQFERHSYPQSATLCLLPQPRWVSLNPYWTRVGSTHVSGGGCGLHSSGGTKRWRYFSGRPITTGGANSSISSGVVRLRCFLSPSNHAPERDLNQSRSKIDKRYPWYRS